MSKRKNTQIDERDLLLTTPLTVHECIVEILKLADTDLKIQVEEETKFRAQLSIVESFNDNLPLHITCRLVRTHDSTTITFELYSQYLEDQLNPPLSKTVFSSMNYLMDGILVLFMTILVMSNPTLAPIFLFLVPVFVAQWLSSRELLTPKHPEMTDLAKEEMHERIEILKSLIVDALHIDPAEVRYDVVGNAYYLDVEQSDHNTA